MVTVNKNVAKSKLYFLIADSSKAKREEIIAMLRSLGYTQFEQAVDGAAAFQILKRRPISFILAAWDMPHMSGITLLRVVYDDEDLFTIPFVLMSSSIDRDMVVEAGKYGVTSILVGSITADMLKDKINGIVAREADEDKARIDGLIARAQQLTKDRQFDAALAIYKEILDGGENPEVYYNIGYIKAAQGKWDEALIAFQKAATLNKQNARAHKMMGEIYLKMGNNAEAEHHFGRAGKIFLERTMDSEAEEVFKEVLKLNPNLVNIYNSLGIIYRRRHNFAEAIKLYNIAMRVDPEDEHIYFNLGHTLLEDNQKEAAKRAFEKALELNPDFQEARQMMQVIELGF